MQKLMKRVSKNKKGFTLIELIIVIVILAILALLVIPRMIGFQDDAMTATCRANQRVMRSAEGMFIAQEAVAGNMEPTIDIAALIGAELIVAADAQCPQTGNNFDRDDDTGVWSCDTHEFGDDDDDGGEG